MAEVAQPMTDEGYEKQQKERAEKIKKLYKASPDNEIIKEMYDEVEEQERRRERKGPSPMTYIHEAVWAAEKAYNDEGVSFNKVCNDLIEAIDLCCKMVADRPRKSTMKGDDD